MKIIFSHKINSNLNFILLQYFKLNFCNKNIYNLYKIFNLIMKFNIFK